LLQVVFPNALSSDIVRRTIARGSRACWWREQVIKTGKGVAPGGDVRMEGRLVPSYNTLSSTVAPKKFVKMTRMIAGGEVMCEMRGKNKLCLSEKEMGSGN
jgi:hypothetical protein